MLAPEDDGPRLETPRFSLASDIVELVVLTCDEIFLQTLRETVGPSRRLWHVPTSDKVSDLLLAGGVGILVLDAQTLRQAGALFITQIKLQFPDLVIVVAGTRETETELARLISDGTVYRFIHKPMSPARARLFADSAVRRYDERRKRTAGTTAAATKPARSGGLIIAAGCALIGSVALGLWALGRADRDDGGHPAATGRLEAADGATSPSVESDAAVPSADNQLLARAAQALAANRLVAPSGDNALELYLQEQARNPASADARAGIAAVRERLLARAENALLEERLDEAAAAIETARRAGVESGHISLLAAELAKARGELKAAADSARTGPAADGAPSTLDPAAASAALAMQRIQEGRLVEPERDSARFYVQEALERNPDSDDAERASEALALGLLSAARGAIERKDFKAASGWLDAARGIASPDNVENLGRVLAAAERPPEDADATPRAAAQSAPEGHAAAGGHDQAGTDGAAPVGDRAAAATDAIDAGRLVIVESVQPEYPRKAREGAIQGWVELEFTVAASGQVRDLSVRAASPRGVFEQAALDAVSQWRYKPVVVDAKPIAQRARIRIRFTLSG